MVIGGVVVYQAGQDTAAHAISETVGAFNRLMRGNAQPVPRDEKERQRQATEQANAKRLRDQQARQLRTDQQNASGGGASAAVEAAARRERAWAKYYKKPTQCEGNPNNETMVECANHHIRAKRQFEEAYAAGKL
jgi:hypothetical protein